MRRIGILSDTHGYWDDKYLTYFAECDEKKAATIVREGDERRAAYYEFYTGKTWGLGSSYDLCVNSSVLGIADTADILCQFIEAKFSKRCDE